MSSPLFRVEVIQARQAQCLGSIRLGCNPRFTSVAITAVLLAAALVAFAAWGQVTRKAIVPGLLVPTRGVIEVNVSMPGVLAETRVSEGQHVETGQVLFVLSTDRATMQGPTAVLVAAAVQQRMVTLEAERTARDIQVRQRREALQDRIRRLEAEGESAGQELGLALRRAELAHNGLERLQQLARESFVSESQVSAKQDEWIELQARAESARRTAAATSREQHSLRAEIRGLEAQWATDRAQMERTAATLQQELIENEARKTVVVAAPRSGVVTNINLAPGTFVHPGQTIATLVATEETDRGESNLQAYLYAPSRATGFVRPGQFVNIRLTPFPHQRFGVVPGVVLSVAETPTNPKDLPAGQAQLLLAVSGSQEPMYKVVVKPASMALDGSVEPVALRPGMTLEASIPVERRSVWAWAMSPAIDVMQRW